MSETYNLDRAQHEAENIDAFGLKWKVVVNRQNGLCHARPEPDRSDAVIPKVVGGQWTKPSMLLEQIKKHVVASWDKAEAARIKAERRAQAEEEQKRYAEQDAKAQERKQAEEDSDKECTGRTEDAGSISDVFEGPTTTGREAATGETESSLDYATLSYAELLEVAKERGITAKKKADILEQLAA